MKKQKLIIDDTELLLNTIISSIEEKKGENIAILDLRQIEGQISDFFIICDGNSKPHINAIHDFLVRNVRNKLKLRPFHEEGLQNMEWVLLDYSSVIVHIFNKENRSFYKLEELWDDAGYRFIESSRAETPNLI